MGLSTEQPVEGHKYSDLTVSLSVRICVESGYGSRKTVEVPRILNEELDLGLTEFPSCTSILNRVQKSGYHTYTETDFKEYPEGYALIMDESMMVGSEKLLLTPGLPSAKTGDSSLTIEDVQVLDMEVKTSWNSASTGEELSKVEERMDAPPAYVISDNASTISKAVRDKNCIHIRDVGHTFGLFMQQTYEKDNSFQTFMKEVTQVKFREIMRPAAYLLPPKQRTIARFMNLSETVHRAVAMLNSFDRLKDEEQKIFRFIPQNQLLIHELNSVFQTVNSILQRLKDEGLSKVSAEECLSRLKSLSTSPNQRIASVGRLMIKYLETEYSKLSDESQRWHISSDIIESMFGTYKGRKSPNKMNGVTKHVFILPLLANIKKMKRVDFKISLEKTILKDLDDWKIAHLSENRTVMRRKLLSAG